MRFDHSASCAFALLAAILLASPLALADGQPKVCIVVAGDPDQGVRQAANSLAERIDARTDMRGVADADARAVLRGEPRAEASWSALAASRRTLTAGDNDSAALDTIGNQFGCALVLEIASRPANLELRAYDVVHRSFRGRTDVTGVDAALIDRFVLGAAQSAATNAPPATPGATSASAATPTATPAVTTTTPPAQTGPRAQGSPWPADAADSAPPATSHTGPLPPAAPGSTSTAASTPAAPADPSPHDSSSSHGSSGPGYVAWGVAGGLAVLLIVGFFVAQSSTSDTPVISVSHPGR